MRSLVCVLALMTAAAACLPEDAELAHPIVPLGGPPVVGGSIGPDAGISPDAAGPNIPDNPTGDGGFPQDAGPFLDAFDFPMDAPEPSNPGGDQIP